MAPQLSRLRATGIYRKLTIVAVSGVLCVAAAGTSALADSWPATGPTAAVVRAADVPFPPFPHSDGVRAVWSTPLNSQQALNSQQSQFGATKQTLIMQTARRAAVARAESVEAAGVRRAAARAAAARAAAARAAAAAAAQQAAAQQAAAQRAQLAAQQSPAGSPQQIARQLLGQYGWAGQFSCLDSLWTNESGWDTYAENPTTGAYGIPQALPGSKMASAGPDWRSDPATQIRWGLSYIQASYGSPCAAWSHEEAVGWY